MLTDMGKLVDKKRAGVDVRLAVKFFDLECGNPVIVAGGGNGKCGRTGGKHIQNDGFSIALIPTPGKKSAFGGPAVSQGGAAVLRPLPVHASVEFVGEAP